MFSGRAAHQAALRISTTTLSRHEGLRSTRMALPVNPHTRSPSCFDLRSRSIATRAIARSSWITSSATPRRMGSMLCRRCVAFSSSTCNVAISVFRAAFARKPIFCCTTLLLCISSISSFDALQGFVRKLRVRSKAAGMIAGGHSHLTATYPAASPHLPVCACARGGNGGGRCGI